MAAKRDALHRLRTFTGTRSLDCSLDRIEHDHRICSVDAAEELAERVGHRDAAGEMRGELTVERRDDVTVFQCEPGGGCDRLLSEAVVHRPADPPLSVERPCSFLESPLHEHQPEELE